MAQKIINGIPFEITKAQLLSPPTPHIVVIQNNALYVYDVNIGTDTTNPDLSDAWSKLASESFPKATWARAFYMAITSRQTEDGMVEIVESRPPEQTELSFDERLEHLMKGTAKTRDEAIAHLDALVGPDKMKELETPEAIQEARMNAMNRLFVPRFGESQTRDIVHFTVKLENGQYKWAKEQAPLELMEYFVELGLFAALG